MQQFDASFSRLKEIQSQIKNTITALEEFCSRDGDQCVADYLERYRQALFALLAEDRELIDLALPNLLNCARGYLERSSNWDQEFLRQMSETERLIVAALSER